MPAGPAPLGTRARVQGILEADLHRVSTGVGRQVELTALSSTEMGVTEGAEVLAIAGPPRARHKAGLCRHRAALAAIA